MAFEREIRTAQKARLVGSSSMLNQGLSEIAFLPGRKSAAVARI